MVLADPTSFHYASTIRLSIALPTVTVFEGGSGMR